MAMYKSMRLVLFFMVTVILLPGCTSCAPADGQSPERSGSRAASYGSRALRITCWNVETFFDCVNTGGEYSEFIESKTWSKEAYIERLKRLCTTIKDIDADVFVMEEIENEGVMYDISNFMAGEWDMHKVYEYGCFAKDDGSSIGCGIISRYPLSDMTVHALDVRTEGTTMPSMRPIIEVSVTNGGERLIILVNHWKSKSGGEEATEVWRNRQEELLAQIVLSCEAKNCGVVACGDFNRDVADFKKGSAADMVLLRKWNRGSRSAVDGDDAPDGVEVEAPWYDDTVLVTPGSYYFNNAWERIDNFFIAGNAHCIAFAPETKGPWCDAATFVPWKYELWNGLGYSDHLPISCTVRF